MLRYIESDDFKFSAMFHYSWTVFRKQFPLLMLLVIIIRAAVNVPLASIGGVEVTPDNWEWFVDNAFWFILLGVAASLLFLLLQLAVMKVTMATAREETIELGDAFRRGFADFGPAILLSIVVFVCLAVLILAPMAMLSLFSGVLSLALPLVLIPVIVVAIYLSFSLQALSVRGFGVFDSLGHSWELVKGRWWRVFGYILGLGIIVGAISYVAQLVLQQIPFAGELLALFAADAFSAFTVIAMTLFFLHLDRRWNQEEPI